MIAKWIITWQIQSYDLFLLWSLRNPTVLAKMLASIFVENWKLIGFWQKQWVRWLQDATNGCKWELVAEHLKCNHMTGVCVRVHKTFGTGFWVVHLWTVTKQPIIIWGVLVFCASIIEWVALLLDDTENPETGINHKCNIGNNNFYILVIVCQCYLDNKSFGMQGKKKGKQITMKLKHSGPEYTVN